MVTVSTRWPVTMDYGLWTIDYGLYRILGNQRRPVREYFTNGWPAGGVAGDAGRAGGHERGEFLGKAFDGGPAGIARANPQHDFRRIGLGRDHTRNAVARAQALDVAVLKLDPGAAHALQDHLAAGARLRR